MSQVRVQTVHNVSIDFEIGSIGERIVATLVDTLILAGYYIIINALFRALSIGYSEYSSYLAFQSIFIFLPMLLYRPLCEYFLDGQTFGKKAVNIKVVRVDGSQPSLGAYLIRMLIGLIEINALMGVPAILAIALGEKGQRLGDMAAGTMVVRLKRLADFNETVFVDYDSNYQPLYGTEVLSLRDSDVGTLKNILNVVDSDSRMPPNIGEILEKAKQNVENVIKVDSNQTPLEFIRQIVKDYNHHSNVMR